MSAPPDPPPPGAAPDSAAASAADDAAHSAAAAAEAVAERAGREVLTPEHKARLEAEVAKNLENMRETLCFGLAAQFADAEVLEGPEGAARSAEIARCEAVARDPAIRGIVRVFMDGTKEILLRDFMDHVVEVLKLRIELSRIMAASVENLGLRERLLCPRFACELLHVTHLVQVARVRVDARDTEHTPEMYGRELTKLFEDVGFDSAQRLSMWTRLQDTREMLATVVAGFKAQHRRFDDVLKRVDAKWQNDHGLAVAAHEAKLREVHAGYRAKEGDWEARLDKLQAEHGECIMEASGLRWRIRQLEDDVARLAAEGSDLLAERNRLRDRDEAAESQMAALHREQGQLRAEVAHSQQQVQLMARNPCQLRRQRKALLVALWRAQRRVNDVQVKLAKLPVHDGEPAVRSGVIAAIRELYVAVQMPDFARPEAHALSAHGPEASEEVDEEGTLQAALERAESGSCAGAGVAPGGAAAAAAAQSGNIASDSDLE